jgi:F-type H+-transporting ATPase subunit c
MTKKLFVLLALMMIASPMIFAQGNTAPANDSRAQWVVMGAGLAGFAMAIASAICGLAQGKAIASAVEGMARNPGAAKAIQLAMLIGLAFIESLALYTLLIVFVKVQ